MYQHYFQNFEAYLWESFSPPKSEWAVSEPITLRNARNFCSVPLKIFPLFLNDPQRKGSRDKGSCCCLRGTWTTSKCAVKTKRPAKMRPGWDPQLKELWKKVRGSKWWWNMKVCKANTHNKNRIENAEIETPAAVNKRRWHPAIWVEMILWKCGQKSWRAMMSTKMKKKTEEGETREWNMRRVQCIPVVKSTGLSNKSWPYKRDHHRSPSELNWPMQHEAGMFAGFSIAVLAYLVGLWWNLEGFWKCTIPSIHKKIMRIGSQGAEKSAVAFATPP